MSRVLVPVEDRRSFTITELAGVFGISVQAVHQWLKGGKLRGCSRSSRRGRYQIPRAEFVRLLKQAGRAVPGIWEPPRRRRLRVLLIDDHPPIRRLAEEASRSRLLPFELRTAPNVEDGIVEAARFLPQVIVLDYFFARDRLRGDQALAFIRKAKEIRDARILGVAGDPALGRRMLKAGADGFLRKPFGVRELRDAILQRMPRAMVGR